MECCKARLKHLPTSTESELEISQSNIDTHEVHQTRRNTRFRYKLERRLSWHFTNFSSAEYKTVLRNGPFLLYQLPALYHTRTIFSCATKIISILASVPRQQNNTRTNTSRDTVFQTELTLGYWQYDRDIWVRSSRGARGIYLLHNAHIVSGAHHSPIVWGTGVYFPTDKAAGAWMCPLIRSIS
jgi:hypothetical protein